MVAGMSSRFGGKPKQMAKIGPNGMTLIEFSVLQALTQQFSKIVFITNEDTEYLFRNIFMDDYYQVPVLYIRQQYNKNIRDRPWGTTDAICRLNKYINEPFILCNGDDIYGESTFEKGYNLIKNTMSNIIGGLPVIETMPLKGTVNRGVIKINGNMVSSLEEMLNISIDNNSELMNELTSVNFIGLQPRVLNLLSNILAKFKINHTGDRRIECLLPDDLNNLIQNKKIKIYFFEIKNKVIGITNPGDEIIVKNIIKNNL